MTNMIRNQQAFSASEDMKILPFPSQPLGKDKKNFSPRNADQALLKMLLLLLQVQELLINTESLDLQYQAQIANALKKLSETKYDEIKKELPKEERKERWIKIGGTIAKICMTIASLVISICTLDPALIIITLASSACMLTGFLDDSGNSLFGKYTLGTLFDLISDHVLHLQSLFKAMGMSENAAQALGRALTKIGTMIIITIATCYIAATFAADEAVATAGDLATEETTNALGTEMGNILDETLPSIGSIASKAAALTQKTNLGWRTKALVSQMLSTLPATGAFNDLSTAIIEGICSNASEDKKKEYEAILNVTLSVIFSIACMAGMLTAFRNAPSNLTRTGIKGFPMSKMTRWANNGTILFDGIAGLGSLGTGIVTLQLASIVNKITKAMADEKFLNHLNDMIVSMMQQTENTMNITSQHFAQISQNSSKYSEAERVLAEVLAETAL